MGFHMMLQERRKNLHPKGQKQRIINYLKACKSGQTSRMISEATGIDRRQITSRITQMLRENLLRITKEGYGKEVTINEEKICNQEGNNIHIMG